MHVRVPIVWLTIELLRPARMNERLRRSIGRCLQADLIADGKQRLMPCGLASGHEGARLRMAHSATARLITQAAPISSARLSSLGGPAISSPAIRVSTCVPAPSPIA